MVAAVMAVALLHYNMGSKIGSGYLISEEEGRRKGNDRAGCGAGRDLPPVVGARDECAGKQPTSGGSGAPVHTGERSRSSADTPLGKAAQRRALHRIIALFADTRVR